MRLNLSRVTNDSRLQRRAKGLDKNHVQTMAQLLTDDESFDLPPVCAVSEGNDFHIWDGWHRIEAYRLAKRKDVPATVTKGTWRDAWRESFGANGTHGLPRTKADIEAVMKAAFEDDEISAQSDREIARLTGLSAMTVNRWRKKLSVTPVTDAQDARTVTRNGTTYEMDTSNIGKVEGGSGKPETNGKPEANGKAETNGKHEGAGKPAKEEMPLRDAVGNLVTPKCWGAFANLERFKALDSLAQQLQKQIDELSRMEGGEQLLRFLQPTGSEGKTINKSEHLNKLKRDLKGTRPHAVCPWCKGKGPTGCKGCSATGWVTKTAWDNAEESLQAGLLK